MVSAFSVQPIQQFSAQSGQAANTLASSTEKAAKAAKKSLAGFDELNILKSSAASGGSGASGSASGSSSKPAASGKGTDTRQLGKIAGFLKDIAGDTHKIAAEFSGLKLGSLIAGLIARLITAGIKTGAGKDGWKFSGEKSMRTVEITLAVTGIALEADGIVKTVKAALDSIDLGAMPGGGGLLASGAAMIGKALGTAVSDAGAGAIAAGLTGIYDAMRKGLSCLGALLTSGGAALVYGGVGALVSLAVDLVSDGVGLILRRWEGIKAWFGELGAWFYAQIIQPLAGFFTRLWSGISGGALACRNGICGFFQPAVDWFSGLFGSIAQRAGGSFSAIGAVAARCWELITLAWGGASGWFDANVAQPVSRFFCGMWQRLTQGAVQAWEGVKGAFSTAGRFFSDTFRSAWEGVKAVFSSPGQVFVQIKDGVLGAFKQIVNGLITGINAVVTVPFNGINVALSRIREIRIFGAAPFAGLKTVSVPRIPYLAQGAVIPPNAPFAAVLGDQRHGTNIEAPLDTIKQAVAQVLGDFIPSNMAGHEATVAVLREILAAVLGIRVGDDVIAMAAERYQAKLALARGEVL